MRIIKVEVPERCGDCKIARSNDANNYLYCLFRPWGVAYKYNLKPVKACRDAEVSQ